MPIAVLFAVLLSAPDSTLDSSSVTGVWVLNLEKSDLGVSAALREVVFRVESADDRLAILEITTTARTHRLSYRQVRLSPVDCSAVGRAARLRGCWVETGNGRFSESWELSDVGELIINRDVSLNFRVVHQRLVLEPSTVYVD